MCGVAGALRVPSPILDAVPLALVTIAHRGPDHSGWTDTEQGRIGTMRLAVMDPAAGQQPMSRDRVSLVFNGEIYNFKELRTDLEKLGHTFRTNSDTEVLLAMYLQHGIDTLDALVGMFAFAIVDERTGVTVLARDRFGKKPLYYARVGSGLAFASEIKALRPILAAAGVQPAIRDQGVYDYLSLGVIPQPDTIFAGIDALEPGSHLTIDADGIRTERWWRPEFKTHDVPVREAHERVRELMADSVRLRLRSDVPLGVFLSGGVDSSVIAYEAAQVLGETVHAFTVATGSGLDESAVAGRTAASLGIRSTVLPLEFDPLESLTRWSITTTSPLPTRARSPVSSCRAWRASTSPSCSTATAATRCSAAIADTSPPTLPVGCRAFRTVSSASSGAVSRREAPLSDADRRDSPSASCAGCSSIPWIATSPGRPTCCSTPRSSRFGAGATSPTSRTASAPPAGETLGRWISNS